MQAFGSLEVTHSRGWQHSYSAMVGMIKINDRKIFAGLQSVQRETLKLRLQVCLKIHKAGSSVGHIVA